MYCRTRTVRSRRHIQFLQGWIIQVGPEHSYLKDTNRVKYTSVTDDEALEALAMLSREEGIIPALESSHAISYGLKLAKEMEKGTGLVICLSGRGDKDVETVQSLMGGSEHE